MCIYIYIWFGSLGCCRLAPAGTAEGVRAGVVGVLLRKIINNVQMSSYLHLPIITYNVLSLITIYIYIYIKSLLINIHVHVHLHIHNSENNNNKTIITT